MTALVGRGPELAVLDALVDAVLATTVRPGAERPAVVVLGEAGIGKTALLAHGAGSAAAAGVRVLAADGCHDESETPFAALGQLLLPLADLVDELPEHPRAAVSAALAGDADGTPTGALHLGVLLLLRRAARRGPVLLVVDDADRLDRESLRAIVFVTRRLSGVDRIGLVLAGRGDVRPLPGDASLPTLALGPLDDRAAAAVVDRRSPGLPAAVRREVLAAGRGNPLALEEFADAGTALPADLSHRVDGLFGPGIRELPAPTRRLLSYAAVADGEPVATIQAAAGTAPDDLAAWGPAERAGIVLVEGAAVSFRHPLARAAAYATTPAADRRTARLALAAADDDPDVAAWQRARACLVPDESVAADLAAAAGRAGDRGDHRAQARAWQRAAACSPDPGTRLERHHLALQASYAAGDADGVAEQREAIRAETDDPTVLVVTTLLAAAALLLHARQREAVRRMQEVVPLIGRATPAGSVLLASFLRLAADFSGAPEHRAVADAVVDRPEVREAVRRVIADADSPADLMWARATVYDRGEAARLLERMLEGGRAGPAATADDLQNLGFLADRADDVRRALELFARAHDRMHHEGPAAFGVPIMATLLVEHGRWTEADAVVAHWTELADARGMTRVAVELAAPRAVLAAMRGDPDRAHAIVAAARRRVDLADNRFLLVRLGAATALAAMVDGDRGRAYRHLRVAFTPDGDPVHPRLSPRLVASLAAAATGPEERRDAALVVGKVRAALGARTSARMRILLHHADALLGDEQQAEHHFRLALADPTGQDWPVERATVRLHYGEWLRRRRRPLEAREMLVAALEAFDALGAAAPADRVRAELRAAGSGDRREVEPQVDPLAELTPQQREIVRLAASGLRNREIAERLFLSPRTVGSHLHHAYPKLGISGRHQLVSVLRTPAG
ncbi:helix-turn-helix transcriptional regulator [Actinomycetospora atypica]|uniref:AAA family ATPase n=1 Tax=Actinomycetospora atypica TaxID=1290095 RepID=A0ABV9YSW7_9PSEU